MDRKLTAILAADVKGYSRLMSDDEVGTLHREEEHENITIHWGRFLDFRADRSYRLTSRPS